MSIQRAVEQVELHDARIASVLIEPGGRASVALEHLSVFEREPNGRRGVWSYTATLRFFDVRRCELTERIDERDYVSDGRVLGSNGEIECVELLNRTPIEEFCATFGANAAQVKIVADSAELVLEKRVRRVEDWTE